MEKRGFTLFLILIFLVFLISSCTNYPVIGNAVSNTEKTKSPLTSFAAKIGDRITTFLQNPAPKANNALIILNSKEIKNYQDVQEKFLPLLKEYNLQSRHILGNFIIIDGNQVPKELFKNPLVEDILIYKTTYIQDEEYVKNKYGQEAVLIVNSWLNLDSNTALKGGDGDHQEAEAKPIEKDMLEPLDKRGTILYYPTSEYLAGTVAVGLILPECLSPLTICTEDPWTTGQKQQVYNEVLAGTDWWVQKAAENNVSLTFVYDTDNVIIAPTIYEPININTTGLYCSGYGDTFKWVEDVLHNLSYQGTCFQVVYNYVNDIKTEYNTDWAFAIFVVNSLKDNNGKFPDGTFASAWRGGPFTVMTYNNSNYGINNMDAVTAHELGHIFWALDQYGGTPCAYKSGYLNIENQNSYAMGCLLNEPSIMRGTITPFTNHNLDIYGAGQLGWEDTDKDGIVDTIDTTPFTTLVPHLPNDTKETQVTYYGTAYDKPLTNQNPAPWNPKENISINTISNVWYRVNSNPYQLATPVDGSFDETNEDYTFTYYLNQVGLYRFETYAMNSVGNIPLQFSLTYDILNRLPIGKPKIVKVTEVAQPEEPNGPILPD